MVKPNRTWLALLGIAAAPLCLALVGLTHPHRLTPESALYWFRIHLWLLPIFPLLGVNLWWLLKGMNGLGAWVARILAFVYIPFYENRCNTPPLHPWGSGAGCMRARID